MECTVQPDKNSTPIPSVAARKPWAPAASDHAKVDNREGQHWLQEPVQLGPAGLHRHAANTQLAAQQPQAPQPLAGQYTPAPEQNYPRHLALQAAREYRAARL